MCFDFISAPPFFSLILYFFTLILGSIPHEVPQILINREPLPHLHFDVELLGDCDVIINELCHRLGGEYAKLCCNPVKLSEITEKPPRIQKELAHLSELPPTPLNISEGSSSPERTSPPDSSVIVTLLDQETKSNVDDPDVSDSTDCVTEKHSNQNLGVQFGLEYVDQWKKSYRIFKRIYF